jgi:hypothetical protein
MQLERTLNFILIYYNGAQLENLLVALVGRFHHRRSPQQVYRSLFQSTFAKKIPLLNRALRFQKKMVPITESEPEFFNFHYPKPEPEP